MEKVKKDRRNEWIENLDNFKKQLHESSGEYAEKLRIRSVKTSELSNTVWLG